MVQLSISSKFMMLKNSLRASHFLVIAMVLSSLSLFIGSITTLAATPGFTPPEDYRQDNSLEIVIDPSEENLQSQTQKDDKDMQDIFGSEQVFPFEMGLGNSAF